MAKSVNSTETMVQDAEEEHAPHPTLRLVLKTMKFEDECKEAKEKIVEKIQKVYNVFNLLIYILNEGS